MSKLMIGQARCRQCGAIYGVNPNGCPYCDGQKRVKEACEKVKNSELATLRAQRDALVGALGKIRTRAAQGVSPKELDEIISTADKALDFVKELP